MEKRRRHNQFFKEFNRMVSHEVAKILYKKTSVTANQVTWFRIFSGLLIGILWLIPSYFTAVVGGVLLQTSSILDAADGELALMRGKSRRGAWLDTQGDFFILFFVFICLSFRFSKVFPSSLFMPLFCMATFSLMLLVKISFWRSKSDKIIGAKEDGNLSEEVTQEKKSPRQTLFFWIDRFIFPSPAFYCPVLAFSSFFNKLYLGVSFLAVYLIIFFCFVQIKTYFVCLGLDREESEG